MFKRKLCPRCQRGKETYELDSRHFECPYITCHDGKRCGMFVEMSKPKRTNLINKMKKDLLRNKP